MKWATEESLFLNNAEFEQGWHEAGCLGESEHDVFPDRQYGIWVKRNNLNQHGTYLEYFHRLLLHNWLFPTTELTFKGFVESFGRLLPVTTQQDIPALRGATSQETDEFMLLLGFTPIREVDSSRQDDYLNLDAGIEVNDLHDENVLIRQNGDLAVMDPVPMMDETSKIFRIIQQLRPH